MNPRASKLSLLASIDPSSQLLCDTLSHPTSCRSWLSQSLWFLAIEQRMFIFHFYFICQHASFHFFISFGTTYCGIKRRLVWNSSSYGRLTRSGWLLDIRLILLHGLSTNLLWVQFCCICYWVRPITFCEWSSHWIKMHAGAEDTNLWVFVVEFLLRLWDALNIVSCIW